jgi:hypothetical protein
MPFLTIWKECRLAFAGMALRFFRDFLQADLKYQMASCVRQVLQIFRDMMDR